MTDIAKHDKHYVMRGILILVGTVALSLATIVHLYFKGMGHYEAGAAHLAAGERAEARAEFRKAIKSFPFLPKFYAARQKAQRASARLSAQRAEAWREAEEASVP